MHSLLINVHVYIGVNIQKSLTDRKCNKNVWRTVAFRTMTNTLEQQLKQLKICLQPAIPATSLTSITPTWAPYAPFILNCETVSSVKAGIMNI